MTLILTFYQNLTKLTQHGKSSVGYQKLRKKTTKLLVTFIFQFKTLLLSKIFKKRIFKLFIHCKIIVINTKVP